MSKRIAGSIPSTVEFSTSRMIDAPRDLVWKLFTQPGHARHWYGPDDFRAPVYEADLRAGGAMLIEMEAPDGTRYPQRATIVEVVPPERIVTDGSVTIGGEHAFTVRTAVRLEAHGDATMILVDQTFTQLSAAGFGATQGSRMGWEQQFGKFETYVQAHDPSHGQSF